MVLTKIGASLGGSADTLLVTQAGHGFVANDIGKAVKMLSTGLYALATADAIGNADVIGIILQRIDANTLLLALSGRVTVDAGVPTGDPGTVLFLPLLSTKTTNVGYLNSTEPSSAGEVSKPMAVITISGSEMILFQMRGEVITTGVISIADNSVTSAKIVDGTIVNADINASAAITYSRLATLADGNILVGNGSGVATSVNPSGDIDISNAGVFELNATAISGFSEKTTVVDADTVLLGDSAASGALKKMTRTNFVAGIGGGTAPEFGRVKRTSGDITTNSTILVDFTDASITFTTGAFPIMYGQIATSRNDTNGAMIAYNVMIDSTLELGTTGIATDHYPANYNADYSFTGQSAELTAASHTVKLQWRVSAGNGRTNADAGYAHIFWAHEIR